MKENNRMRIVEEIIVVYLHNYNPRISSHLVEIHGLFLFNTNKTVLATRTVISNIITTTYNKPTQYLSPNTLNLYN